MNADEYQHWQFEHDLIGRLLTDVERVEHAILAEVNCPSDLVSIYAILSGEQPRPWPKKTAADDQKRALHAMHTLALVAKTRAYLNLGHENAQAAAYAALLAGMYAGDAVLHAMRRARTRKTATEKGRKGGIASAQEARRKEREIARYIREWETSDESRDTYSSLPVYIKARTGWSLKTIQRRMSNVTPGQ